MCKYFSVSSSHHITTDKLHIDLVFIFIDEEDFLPPLQPQQSRVLASPATSHHPPSFSRFRENLFGKACNENALHFSFKMIRRIRLVFFHRGIFISQN